MGLDNPHGTRRRIATIGARTQQYLNASPGDMDTDAFAFAGAARLALTKQEVVRQALREAGETPAGFTVVPPTTSAVSGAPAGSDGTAVGTSAVSGAGEVGSDGGGGGGGPNLGHLSRKYQYDKPPAARSVTPSRASRGGASGRPVGLDTTETEAAGQWVADVDGRIVDTRYTMQERRHLRETAAMKGYGLKSAGSKATLVRHGTVGRAASWMGGTSSGGSSSVADSAGADGGTAALEEDDDAAVGLRSGRTDGSGLMKSALKSRYAMPGLAVKKSVRVDPHTHALGGGTSGDPFADIGIPVATARSLSPRAGGGSGRPLPEDAVVGQYGHALLELCRKYEVDNISPVFHDFGAPYIDAGERGRGGGEGSVTGVLMHEQRLSALRTSHTAATGDTGSYILAPLSPQVR